MIDGKLTEGGRDVMNVQAVLICSQPTCECFLEDADGKFVTVPEEESEGEDNHTRSEHPESEEEKEKLNALKEENQKMSVLPREPARRWENAFP